MEYFIYHDVLFYCVFSLEDILLFLIVCIGMLSSYTWVQMVLETRRGHWISPRARVTGHCELPGLSSGKWTQDLSASIAFSQVVSCLSSLYFTASQQHPWKPGLYSRTDGLLFGNTPPSHQHPKEKHHCLPPIVLGHVTHIGQWDANRSVKGLTGIVCMIRPAHWPIYHHHDKDMLQPGFCPKEDVRSRASPVWNPANQEVTWVNPTQIGRAGNYRGLHSTLGHIRDTKRCWFPAVHFGTFLWML